MYMFMCTSYCTGSIPLRKLTDSQEGIKFSFAVYSKIEARRIERIHV